MVVAAAGDGLWLVKFPERVSHAAKSFLYKLMRLLRAKSSFAKLHLMSWQWRHRT